MFSALTSKIFGGASIALLLALVGCWIGWTHAAHQRDDQIRRNGELNLKLAVSNQSIETLTATIKQMNAEADARANAYTKAQQDASEADQRLKKQAQASQGQIDRLRALAASGGDSGCKVSPELNDALEGL